MLALAALSVGAQAPLMADAAVEAQTARQSLGSAARSVETSTVATVAAVVGTTTSPVTTSPVTTSVAQSGPTATSGLAAVTRSAYVSRGSALRSVTRVAVADARLQVKVERRADARSAALERLDVAASRHERVLASRWVMPLSGYRLTSDYGPRWGRLHAGLDLAAPSGTPLVAVAAGTVVSASSAGGYGNRTILRLDDGTSVWYAHQSAMVAEPGDRLAGGDLIGYVGSTGNSTGPHLHLEIHPSGGAAVDPSPFLAEQGLHP